MRFSTFRCELTQSFAFRIQCSGGTRPRDFPVINTVILCPLYFYSCSTISLTRHIQFIPLCRVSFTEFAHVHFLPQSLHIVSTVFINLLTPNVNYSGRTAPLTSKVAFYIFIQQIYVLNILNMLYTLRFFLFKMQFVS